MSYSESDLGWKKSDGWVSDVWNLLSGLSPATTPHIYNINLSEANREYFTTLPSKTKRFLIQSVDGNSFRISFERGRVAGNRPYFTIPEDTSYSEDSLLLEGRTIYMSSSTPSVMVEIICWT